VLLPGDQLQAGNYVYTVFPGTKAKQHAGLACSMIVCTARIACWPSAVPRGRLCYCAAALSSAAPLTALGLSAAAISQHPAPVLSLRMP
jgi:hypothetical protein